MILGSYNLLRIYNGYGDSLQKKKNAYNFGDFKHLVVQYLF